MAGPIYYAYDFMPTSANQWQPAGKKKRNNEEKMRLNIKSIKRLLGTQYRELYSINKAYIYYY